MPVPGLLKRGSTISERFQGDLSRSSSEPATNLRASFSEPTVSAGTEPQEEEANYVLLNRSGVQDVTKETATDDDAGTSDTDVAPSDDELEKQIKKAQEHHDDIEPPIRMSKRLMSLKRRGKAVEIFEEPEKFDYFAGDILTVRGEDTDFYVCRVLEDVQEHAEDFRIAWYDRVEDNIYKISYDDTIYDASVITHVTLLQREDGTFQLTPKSLKLTLKILKKSTRAGKIGKEHVDEEKDADTDADVEGDDEDEAEEEESPPAKKRRKTSAGKREGKKEKSPGKPKISQPKKEKKSKPPKEKTVKLRGLLPNPYIDVTEEDTMFFSGKDIPISPLKLGVKAVLRNDMKLLEKAINDVENVYTIFWTRSPDISYGPVEYALLSGNRAALELMKPDKMPKERKARRPIVSLSKMDTGTYNFYTFGHAVRDVEASRGSREGNNAFLKLESHTSRQPEIAFCMKNGISHELIDEFCSEDDVIDNIWEAIRKGHRKLAAHYVGKAVKREGHGFNFLHQETLEYDDQPLSKFRVQSVTKKPYMNKKILPLHCAFINPNPTYAQALIDSLQEYNRPDAEMWKPIHYAAVCEGPGPLALLFSRGVDPNDVTKDGRTPLSLAAECGRDGNIRALMSVTFTEEVDDEGGTGVERKKVNINGKLRNTMAAIHYAAKNGHESTVRVLVEEGAKVDLQAGSGQNNFTALAFAAQKGHFHVVKALCELGASPDKKLRQNKTALMHATINGHYNVMSYLLNLGVNPNAADSSLNTPIHYAAAYGWYHCLQLLLEAGGNPNCANNWKTTPLSVALMKDHIPCADLLLSLDVDVDFKDDNGKTILMFELLSKYDDQMLERVEYLVKKKGANPNITDKDGFSSLHVLASHSVYRWMNRGSTLKEGKTVRNGPAFDKEMSDICCQAAKILLEAGADPNIVDDMGQTPLMVAVMQNNFLLIDLLFNHGAQASKGKVKTSLETPLHCIVNKSDKIDLFEYYGEKYNDPESYDVSEIDEIYCQQLKRVTLKVVKQLLEHEVDVDAVTKSGETALMLAINQGNPDVIDLLLKSKANPTIGKDQYGRTALHLMSAMSANQDLTSYLTFMNEKYGLKDSTLKEQVDNDGYTPLLLACEAHYSKYEGEYGIKFIKALVEELDVDVYAQVQKFNTEKDSCHRARTNYKLEADKDPSGKYQDYHITGLFTCLHFMAMENRNESKEPLGLEMMLEYTKRRKGFINTVDRHGRTPLHLACYLGKEQQIRTLIQHGAELNLLSGNKSQDERGSALYICASQYHMIDAAKELIEAGADPNTQSAEEKRSPLMKAIVALKDDTAKLDYVSMLLKAGASVDLRDTTGKTVMHLAAGSTSGGYETLTEVEDLLVSYKADVTITDNYGRVPLHYAFMDLDGSLKEDLADPISIVTMLCESGAEQSKSLPAILRKQDNRGNTPLHLAAMRGATMSCILLLQKGASLDIKNKDGNYPLSLALRGSHHGCAMMYIQEGASANCNVCWPVTEEAIKTYEKSLEEKKWVWEFSSDKADDPPKKVVESSFLVAIKNDWQGVAYLMLQMGGLPFIDAYKAALQANKIQLLWTILKKQKKSEPLFAVDENGAGLLHILAMYSTKCTTYVKNCRDVAELLINKQLSALSTDIHGCTPLHYAAEHGDYSLCEMFIKHAPEALNMMNKRGMNPATLAFEAGINAQAFNVRVIKLLINGGTEKLDLLYDTQSKMQNEEKEYTTVLNDLVLCGNIGNFEDTPDSGLSVPKVGCIEYFISKGGTIDFANGIGHTPIMTAVIFNKQDVAELLLKYQPNLSLRDKAGWTVVHHCVQTSEYASYENEELLELLAKNKAPLNLRDEEGHTPAFYAMRRSSTIMLENLKKLHSKYGGGLLGDDEEIMDTDERGYQFSTTRGQYWDCGKIDPGADAKKEMEALKNIEDVSEPVPFDGKVFLGGSCKIYVDPVKNVPYDAVLTKVDVRWGKYGLNSFYKLQVVHHVTKNLWILFNRWGRIGDNGKHQQTPYNNPEEAVREFQKIFKSKTGNEWTKLPSFEKKPKKYTILVPEKNPERMLHRREEVIKDYDPEASPESKLPDSLREFLRDFVDPKNVKDSVARKCEFDSNFLPFGLISRDTLEKAMEILDEIQSIIDSLNAKDIRMDPDAPGIYAKVASLSNDFFMIVPPTNYQYERIRPLNGKSDVCNERKRLRTLMELSHSSQLLLAAQHRYREINPLDYCYQALNTHVEVMDPKSDESQLILEYIHRQQGNSRVTITGIYRVQRLQHSAAQCKLGNKHLLWHGTKTAHMIGILKDGLQIDAPHAFVCGSRFGKGIYFATSFEKSLGYCDYYSSVCRYLLLCEVSLGKVHYSSPKDNFDDESWKINGDSFWQVGVKIPHPNGTKTTPYGAKVACGVRIDHPARSEQNQSLYRFEYENEVVVYDPSQVRIRYVVRVKK